MIPIIKQLLSAAKTMRRLSSHICPENASIFIYNQLDLKKNLERNPHTPAYRGKAKRGTKMEGNEGEGRQIKCSYTRGGGGKEGRPRDEESLERGGRGREGATGQGDLAPRS